MMGIMQLSETPQVEGLEWRWGNKSSGSQVVPCVEARSLVCTWTGWDCGVGAVVTRCKRGQDCFHVGMGER
jgi:hypothetical protein